MTMEKPGGTIPAMTRRSSSPSRHRRSSSRGAAAPGPGPGGRGKLRIIGGDYRRRQLPVPDSPGLRPTPDRVRETLFNWLTGVTPGARVLDLYAGTGALGLEALSRGARQACFVERESRIAQGLDTNLATLGAGDRGRVAAQAAEAFLAGPAMPFDLVFLDPPFRQELAEAACVALEENGWLAPEAWIYVEVEQELALRVPARWQLHREVKAGDTLGRLYRRQARHASPSPAGDAC